jgi:two-component system, chemotaxis family, chemotaxis protein CheY
MARILVAEDVPDLRDLLERIFALDGHDVITATDGFEALARYAQGSFDLICSDLDMPRLDGIELTRAVRADAADVVPILMVSGSASEDDIREAHAAGISAFLPKPFNPSRLREHVRELLVPPG